AARVEPRLCAFGASVLESITIWWRPSTSARGSSRAVHQPTPAHLYLGRGLRADATPSSLGRRENEPSAPIARGPLLLRCSYLPPATGATAPAWREVCRR